MTDTDGFSEIPAKGCQCAHLCTCKHEKQRPRFLNLAKRSFTNIRLVRSPKTPPESVQSPMTPPEESRPSIPFSSTTPISASIPSDKMESPVIPSPTPRTPIPARKPLPTVTVPTTPFIYYDTPEQTPISTVRRDSSLGKSTGDFGLPSSKPIKKRSFSLVPENTPRSPILPSKSRARGQSMDQTKKPTSFPKRKPVPIRTGSSNQTLNISRSDDILGETIEQTIAWLETEQYEERENRLPRSSSPVSPLSEKADDIPGSPEYTPLPLHHERIIPKFSGSPSFSSGTTLSSSPSLNSNSTATSIESRSKTPPVSLSAKSSRKQRIPARKPVAGTSSNIQRKALPKRQKSSTNIQMLPDDIILNIISYLPSLGSVMSSRLISAKFNEIVSANDIYLIRASNPSAYDIIDILFPGDNNFESFRSAYNSCLGVIDGLISRIRRRCPGLLRREMLDPLNREEVSSMRMALWNIWCFNLVFSANYSVTEDCIKDHRVWLARFGRKELFAMIEMCGLISVLLRPLLEIAYSVELTDKFRRDAYYDDEPLGIKERYELIENLLGFLRTVGLDHIYELSSIFGSSETAASPRITRNIACDYIIENLLTETWERELGKEYASFMMKPMKDLHLHLEKEARKNDLDGKKARGEMGWGPTTPGIEGDVFSSE